MNQRMAFDMWLSHIRGEKPCALATVLPGSPAEASRLFIPQEGQPEGSLHDVLMEKKIIELACRKLGEKNPKSESITCVDEKGQENEVFLDIYLPASDIVIFGAGHDAVPVAHYAVSLGWRTTVIDPRPAFNSEDRFPGVNRILSNISHLGNQLAITDRTYVIVMNHHIERDRETLKYVLETSAPYIGVLGPRKRRVKMMEHISEEGITYSEEQLSRIYSPIGLDIGSETPEEIALSILGEIIAVKKGHTGGFLHNSSSIHQANQAAK